MKKVTKKEFINLHRNKKLEVTHNLIRLPAEKIAEQLKIWENENSNFVNELTSITVMDNIDVTDDRKKGIFFKVFTENVCNRTFYILQAVHNPIADWEVKHVHCNVYILLDNIN